MEDSLITIFSIILAAILMFIFPIMNTWERQDDISYMSIYADTVEFVDSARNLGYITLDMYESFLKSIYATGNTYDITLEHRNFEIIPSGDDYRSIYINSYTESIRKKLEDEKIYKMSEGDYFYVSVKNTNMTQATQLMQVVFASPQEPFRIGVPYGGMVRNSAPND